MTGKFACGAMALGMLAPILYARVGIAEGHSAVIGCCFLIVFTLFSALKADFSKEV